MPKPRIFVSSTIYDFRDLRSALKFWLEKQGFEVLLSEVNDFDKDAVENSYQACLDAIETADYFVLLVGARLGGQADKASGTTITMAEYRRARKLFDEGKIKLVSFVRSDLWTVREDRGELERQLKKDAVFSKEMSEEELSRLKSIPTKIANDATRLSSFIAEIARIEEMRAAVDGEGPYPKGNWVHQFDRFSDIIDALVVELRLPKWDLQRTALAALVRTEVVQNIRSLVSRGDNSLFPVTKWMRSARERFGGGVDGTTVYRAVDVKRMALFSMPAKQGAKSLKNTFIREALLSGAFLEFNPIAGTFRPGSIHEALFQLDDAIEWARADGNKLEVGPVLHWTRTVKGLADDAHYSLPNLDAIPLMILNDQLENIFALSRWLNVALQGNCDSQDAGPPRLLPRSPIPSEAKQIDHETPTTQDIEEWLVK